MRRHLRLLCTGLAFTCLIGSAATSLQAQFVIPVSRVLHAQASASDSGGSTSDNPPDLLVNDMPGAFSQSALALSPMGFAQGRGATSSTVTPNGTVGSRSVLDIVASASGTILVGVPPLSGGGSANQQVVLDVPNDLMIAQDVMAFGSGGGFTIMSLKIENDSGGVILNRSYSPNTNISNFPIFLPADRYIFTFSASDFIHIAGSSGGGFLSNFKVVPEPAGLMLGSIGAIALMRRRGRATRP